MKPFFHSYIFQTHLELCGKYLLIICQAYSSCFVAILYFYHALDNVLGVYLNSKNSGAAVVTLSYGLRLPRSLILLPVNLAGQKLCCFILKNVTCYHIILIHYSNQKHTGLLRKLFYHVLHLVTPPVIHL